MNSNSTNHHPWRRVFRRANGFVAFLVGLVVLGAATGVSAQSTNQLRLTIVDGNNQQVSAGTALPKRFTVKVANVLGLPYVGARVTFYDSPCIAFPGQPPCPAPQSFGLFDGFDYDR